MIVPRNDVYSRPERWRQLHARDLHQNYSERNKLSRSHSWRWYFEYSLTHVLWQQSSCRDQESRCGVNFLTIIHDDDKDDTISRNDVSRAVTIETNEQSNKLSRSITCNVNSRWTARSSHLKRKLEKKSTPLRSSVRVTMCVVRRIVYDAH